ncbi:hypothetical protein [Undibacterium crateris]|uniref:hypothetical protein n=1 Tax=Undibacterium crateris TaxID=2528175 RepID=UPI00138A582D|nr:hypothetical protein [Undibacterium crateris]NDI84842.1 hypothetical protein [Undibacterium crateris]
MSGCRHRKTRRKHLQPLRRRDITTRMLVDIGIHYATILGTELAAVFLRRQAIPEAVISRVLLLPTARGSHRF